MAVLQEYTIFAEFVSDTTSSRWEVELDQDWNVTAAKCNDIEVKLTPKREEIIFKRVKLYCDLHDLDNFWRHEELVDEPYWE